MRVAVSNSYFGRQGLNVISSNLSRADQTTQGRGIGVVDRLRRLVYGLVQDFLGSLCNVFIGT